jgi:hypothetical protein
MRFGKLDYCQYLLSSQINYTLTNLAEHLQTISHDQINRYLKKEKLTPRLLWENVQPSLKLAADAYIIFDDTVLNKRYSSKIEINRRQYSGNDHRVIQKIGLVSCVYVNPITEQFWVIDYRLYDPDTDGKTKLMHVQEILEGLVYSKKLPFGTVLMDSWYASKNLMQLIDKLGKIYYCPLNKNRLVDDSGGQLEYQKIEALSCSQTELETGKIIKIKTFPKDKKVKLFRVTVSTNRTEFIATNDITQNSTEAVQEAHNIRAHN